MSIKDISSFIIYHHTGKEIVIEIVSSLANTIQEEIYNSNNKLENYHNAASLIVNWHGIKDECVLENKIILCKTNPIIMDYILKANIELIDDISKDLDVLKKYALNELKLSEKQKDGSSLREHLEMVREVTGHVPQELIPLTVSSDVMYLWEWFLQLNAARQNNGMAISPLSYSEIQAWVTLMQINISPFEVTIIKALDNMFINHINNQNKEDK